MNNTNSIPVVSFLARLIVEFPKLITVASVILMVGLLSALPKLYKDTRADAFLAEDNPALLYKDKVKEQFGLADPIVIALVNESKKGVFNPRSLQLVDWLTEEISALDNVNADRVTSLATENNITGTDGAMEVEGFFSNYPSSQLIADDIWQQVSDFPLYMGTLVSKDRQATLVVAELIDEDLVEGTYQDILALVEKAKKGGEDQLYVAGEGAIAGYLGSYIDADAQRLNPIAGVIITLIILLAFQRLSPALLSNVIIAASVLMTLSVMAIMDVPFFVITNALPVILIGISVADSIHIYSHYFELQAKYPDRDKRNLLVETLEAMWRPITLTTLTTVAGFVGLYLAAYMPPFKYFGMFTAVGVLIAWVYSLVFLPAAMAIIKPRASKRMIRLSQSDQLDLFANAMSWFGRLTLNNAKSLIVIYALIVGAGVFSASYLSVNEDRISTFHPSESIYKADKTINRHMSGTNNLDIVIEANEAEGLFEPESLQKIQALQTYALSLNSVQGATSIVDYLKQMNRSLNGGSEMAYVLPMDKDLVAQYFLIYSASSDPTDFEEEVDYDYRVANMRLNLNKGSYLDTKDVMQSLERYIEQEFNTDDLSATLSGRVTVNYHWIKDLGESHFVGLAISLFLVWAVSSFLFGSASAGLYSVIPVASSILIVYAAMVLLRIDLGIGTSMFASVAIGLGVDFAIHTIDRLKFLFNEHSGDWDKALSALYPSTGRALFFNYLAIALGFGVLITSKVVPLTNFGSIVVVAVTTSFLASMSLLPALIKVFKPAFIRESFRGGEKINETSLLNRFTRIAMVILFVGAVGGMTINNIASASETDSLDALTVVNKVNSVDDGEFVTRDLKMTLTDKRGKQRVRDTSGYRKYYEGEKRTILFYKKPSNVKNTSFLTFDYSDVSKDDDQWLYLPALRKVRRISASDRGDYFLGTDFTYEDIKLEGRLDTNDNNYQTMESEILTLESGLVYNTIKMQSTPKNDVVSKALGYGRTEFWVDTQTWLVIKAVYWDTKGQLLKTLLNEDIREVDGILTRHRVKVENHKTGHRTQFEFRNVDYQSPVKDSLFTKRSMKQGG